ncbi:hypothetical protein J6TS1_02720 [Siminovitchia terrae]|uniref:Uncharacterized protein n=1 Tax=Siminovitchia terrae TaxID=1914933 RepID=A0ABQ4KSZ4_SIMTE|nr:hypothetical protein J6TS1_02720 [Siminovitchia terrae]
MDYRFSILVFNYFISKSRTPVNKHLHILSNAGLSEIRRLDVKPDIRLVQNHCELKDWLTFFEHYWDKKLLAFKKDREENNDQ